MTDHAEEQALEAEALEAIFDTYFTKTADDAWQIDVYPELDDENHVACRLDVSLPPTYPEVVPIIEVTVLKGLTKDHAKDLRSMANEEAEANLGAPSIYAIAEKLREWLLDNNRPGLDDISMHAQMLRKQQQQTEKKKKEVEFEAQVQEEKMTEAEKEELEVRKRRAEGTPCTLENFRAWKARFEAEMAKDVDDEEEKNESGRKTGYEYFSDKSTNLEALEKAAEEADEGDLEDELDEELFENEEDVDLDDLDFDEEEDEDEDDELDI